MDHLNNMMDNEPLKNYSILLVSKDVMSCHVQCLHLQEFGYIVIPVNNDSLAFDVIEKEDIDIAIFNGDLLAKSDLNNEIYDKYAQVPIHYFFLTTEPKQIVHAALGLRKQILKSPCTQEELDAYISATLDQAHSKSTQAIDHIFDRLFKRLKLITEK